MQASESSPKHNFFVSYSKADRGWAEWIAWQLEDAGYTTILQAWDFRAGSNWALNMKKATQGSERMIAVLSPDYLKSQNAQAEWAAAFATDPAGLERRIMPIRVRPVDLAGLDSTIVYIDLVDKDEQTAKAILNNELRAGRLKPAHPPPFPSRSVSASAADAVVLQSIKPQFPVAQLASEEGYVGDTADRNVTSVTFDIPGVLTGELPGRAVVGFDIKAAPLQLFLNFDQDAFEINASPSDTHVRVTEKSSDHQFELSFSKSGRYDVSFVIRARKIENANGRLGITVETHDHVEIKAEKRWINVLAHQKQSNAGARLTTWLIQHRLTVIVAGGAGALAIAALGIGLFVSSRRSDLPLPAPERSITYSIVVKPLVGPVRVYGKEMLFPPHYGLKFRFQSSQPGFLYLVNQGPETAKGRTWHWLFPYPAFRSGSAAIAAGEMITMPQNQYYELDEKSGREIIFVVWSDRPLDVLESIQRELFERSSEGELTRKQAEFADVFFQSHNTPINAVSSDSGTTLRARNPLLIKSIVLEHL